MDTIEVLPLGNCRSGAIAEAEIDMSSGKLGGGLGGAWFAGLHRCAITCLFLVIITVHTFVISVDLLDWPLVVALLILGLGVPHGALDIELAKTHRHLTGIFQISSFIWTYAALAGLTGAAWFMLPGWSLAAFLLISAYHFGGDWQEHVGVSGRFGLGAALLSATALFHDDQVAQIFAWLAPKDAANWLASSMQGLAPLLLVFSAGLAAKLFQQAAWVSVEILITLGGAALLPPITFFLIYFCLLHSPRHFVAARMELAHLSLPDLVGAALPYALVAIMGSIGGALMVFRLQPGPALLASVFMMLAALTTPHMILVDSDSGSAARRSYF